MRRRHLVLLVAVLALLPAPAGGAAAPKTVRLAIAHVVSNCHVWRTTGHRLYGFHRVYLCCLHSKADQLPHLLWLLLLHRL